MEFEDSRNALFCEPNAYIQHKVKIKETKKIVFQQPYETLPNFYVNNSFSKGDCDCVKTKHNNNIFLDNGNCPCKNEHTEYCSWVGKPNCEPHKKHLNGFNFDIKNFLPLLGAFTGGKGGDINKVVSMFSENLSNKNSPNTMNLITNLLKNKDIIGMFTNMLNGGGLSIFQQKSSGNPKVNTTDFEIKNYTRVE